MVDRAVAQTMAWFSSPLLPSVESTRRARSLWSLTWSFLGLLAVLLGVASVLAPETATRRAISIAMVSALVFGLHVLNRRGHTVVASWLLCLGLILIVTQRAWFTGGIQSSVSVFYIMFVLMAAGLLGTRGVIYACVGCLCSATFLVIAELSAWLPHRGPQGSTAEAFIATVLALSVTVLCLTLLLRLAGAAAREELMHMFVHDMRSPLTVVMAHLAMLRDDLADDPQLAEHADAAMAGTARASQMADNLLDVSRLETDRLPLVRKGADISQLARTVTRSMAVLDPSRHIHVMSDHPVLCDCDAELVRRIIENLVSNAIKHTDLGGTITVSVSEMPALVRITVADDGLGIPAHSRDRIFERYSALSVSSRQGVHSVGLGLAFCRLAAKSHGGTIRVEENAPHGSRFIVELPKQ